MSARRSVCRLPIARMNKARSGDDERQGTIPSCDLRQKEMLLCAAPRLRKRKSAEILTIGTLDVKIIRTYLQKLRGNII